MFIINNKCASALFQKPVIKNNQFKEPKTWISFISDTVVNRALTSFLGGSLEIKLTVFLLNEMIPCNFAVKNKLILNCSFINKS